jgi:phosphohistidine phosphatase
MLWLWRHAKAADGRPDAARPLTARGIRDAQATGVALARLGVRLDVCLSSPKRRALETAELVCKPLGVEVVAEPALAGFRYEPQDLAAGLGDVLLVGHNPAISSVLGDLTGARVRMRAAGIAGVDGGELVLLMTPGEIGAIAESAEAAA